MIDEQVIKIVHAAYYLYSYLISEYLAVLNPH